jgi:hypothetical protein
MTVMDIAVRVRRPGPGRAEAAIAAMILAAHPGRRGP